MPNPISLLTARRVAGLQKKGRETADTFILPNVREMDRFLFSGKPVVPFAIQHMSSMAVASAMQRASVRVQQRSVKDLIDITRGFSEQTWDQEDGAQRVLLKSEFELRFSRRPIWTQFYPKGIRRLFCFERTATGVLRINRGLVITDNFAGNLSGILDALGKLKESPLDHVLITLRMMQG